MDTDARTVKTIITMKISKKQKAIFAKNNIALLLATGADPSKILKEIIEIEAYLGLDGYPTAEQTYAHAIL